MEIELKATLGTATLTMHVTPDSLSQFDDATVANIRSALVEYAASRPTAKAPSHGADADLAPSEHAASADTAAHSQPHPAPMPPRLITVATMIEMVRTGAVAAVRVELAPGDVCGATGKRIQTVVDHSCVPGTDPLLLDVRVTGPCEYTLLVGIPELCAVSGMEMGEPAGAPRCTVCVPE
jgi:hypothetical protein